MTTTDLPADGCSEFIGKNCGRRDATRAAQPREGVPEQHALWANELSLNAGGEADVRVRDSMMKFSRWSVNRAAKSRDRLPVAADCGVQFA